MTDLSFFLFLQTDGVDAMMTWMTTMMVCRLPRGIKRGRVLTRGDETNWDVNVMLEKSNYPSPPYLYCCRFFFPMNVLGVVPGRTVTNESQYCQQHWPMTNEIISLEQTTHATLSLFFNLLCLCHRFNPHCLPQ